MALRGRVAIVATSMTVFGATAAGASPVAPGGGHLVAFRSCGELLSYVRTHAAPFVTGYGLGQRAGIAVAPRGAPTPSSTPQQGVDYSGTNVQEAGVDEPDISAAESDHHAFLYWPATGLVVVPFGQQAVALHVSRSAGIGELGRIVHSRVRQAQLPQLDRSVVVRDTLLTVSSAGVAANGLESLTSLGWTPFPAPAPAPKPVPLP